MKLPKNEMSKQAPFSLIRRIFFMKDALPLKMKSISQNDALPRLEEEKHMKQIICVSDVTNLCI